MTEEKARSKQFLSQLRCGQSPKKSPGVKNLSATVEQASIKYRESMVAKTLYERRRHNKRDGRCVQEFTCDACPTAAPELRS
jgi:hypothetical protein